MGVSVPVVQIGIVRMTMHQRSVLVPMHVRLARRIGDGAPARPAQARALAVAHSAAAVDARAAGALAAALRESSSLP